MARCRLLSETAWERLLAPPADERDMVRHYVLGSEDLELVRAKRTDATRLGFALLLLYLRHPGRVLGAGEVPPTPLIGFVARQLGVRRATFVYVDEAHEYFDDTIDELLNQARKFKVGLVLAHQNLEQLSERLRATIMASTSIKFAGGVSARDASAFAKEMRCDPEFVQSMRKHAKTTEFACWIKNTTPLAIKIEVPLGVVGDMPKLYPHAYDWLIEANRARYCAPAGEGASVQPRPQASRQGGKPGKGEFELGSPELL